MIAPPGQEEARCRANGKRAQGETVGREDTGLFTCSEARLSLPVNFPRWVLLPGEVRTDCRRCIAHDGIATRNGPDRGQAVADCVTRGVTPSGVRTERAPRTKIACRVGSDVVGASPGR